jgi:hypothetical protein
VGERMGKETIRNSGISTIGSVNWGTHVCQLYHTKEDLMEILIPYLKAGLDNNEFCIWISSNTHKARTELSRSVQDLDSYIEKGQLEIILFNDWYFKKGVFDLEETLNNWIEKLNQALTSGYEGLRLTEDIFLLENEYWDDFMQYEKELDRVIGNNQIIALCTYSINNYNASKTMDIIENHQFALVKKKGRWEELKNLDEKT